MTNSQHIAGDLRDIDALLLIMRMLRDPTTGCPWDQKQNFQSILPHTIEEAYEVADAIERCDFEALKDELGDLLLQIVYHSQMAEELNLFNFSDVVLSINNKMIRRHPHVFGEEAASDPHDVNVIWEREKHKERPTKHNDSMMNDVPKALPALQRAQKIQKIAAHLGFDWPTYQGVFIKLTEEIHELKDAIDTAQRVGENSGVAIAEEMGDVMFSLVNLCRHLDLRADQVLGLANKKFVERFKHMEQSMKGQDLAALSADEWEELWRAAKMATAK